MASLRREPVQAAPQARGAPPTGQETGDQASLLPPCANSETNTADANKNGSDSQPPIIKPIAEKVPNNLDISKYAYDPATESCNADMMMVGDPVTSGTSDAIQAAFPNAFIDGLPTNQLPQVWMCISRTPLPPQWQCGGVGLGTNGVISK